MALTQDFCLTHKQQAPAEFGHKNKLPNHL